MSIVGCALCPNTAVVQLAFVELALRADPNEDRIKQTKISNRITNSRLTNEYFGFVFIGGMF